MASAGEAVFGRLTCDGGHVLLARAAKPPWAMFSLATAGPAGRVTLDPKATDVCVVGPRVFEAVEARSEGRIGGATPVRRTLAGHDPARDKRLWERPLRGYTEGPPVG